jgi:hypothetical protein
MEETMIKSFFIFLMCMVCFFIFSTGVQAETGKGFIDQNTVDTVKEALLQEHGESNRFRIERGVEQAARFWKEEDGSAEMFAKFCKENFVGAPDMLDMNFKRLEMYGEILNGYFSEMIVDLKQPLELDWGPVLPIDAAFGEFDPSAHLMDDLFENKIAFTILLNFPHYTLEEKTRQGETWSRKEWAYSRIGDRIMSRIPAAVGQEISASLTQAEAYIAEYNICMGNLIDEKGNTYFPADMKLISHWGIRDELKARYNDPNGLFKQKMIYKVMERIIFQEIPGIVIDNPGYRWNPFTNKVFEKGKEIEANVEPDTRYRYFLNTFKALRKADPYYPYHATHIKRTFEVEREIPEAEVEALFKELLSSAEVKKAAQLIRKRLKRELYPFDIWYPGFKGNISISEEELDKITAEKYPDIEAFEKGIAGILVKLGFAEEKAKIIASKIQVNPARGIGHCYGAEMRSAGSRLRTRVPKGGLNYKGFNIAVHELGHAVEQTLTLQDIDYYSLHGVPNTAFTEAFAYVFQDRDLEMLGIKHDDPDEQYLKNLDIFWSAYEIMGVGLVDMKAWNWMYNHPDASPAELKQAVISIAREVWNQYYAPIFKVKDQPILAIYSHMIDSALYLPDYPLGYVIQFQIEKYLEGKNVGKEMARMCASGTIIPQLWMKHAVGSGISVKPLLEAVNEALKHIKK